MHSGTLRPQTLTELLGPLAPLAPHSAPHKGESHRPHRRQQKFVNDDGSGIFNGDSSEIRLMMMSDDTDESLMTLMSLMTQHTTVLTRPQTDTSHTTTNRRKYSQIPVHRQDASKGETANTPNTAYRGPASAGPAAGHALVVPY